MTQRSCQLLVVLAIEEPAHGWVEGGEVQVLWVADVRVVGGCYSGCGLQG